MLLLFFYLVLTQRKFEFGAIFNSKVGDTELKWAALLTLIQIFFVLELYKTWINGTIAIFFIIFGGKMLDFRWDLTIDVNIFKNLLLVRK